MSGFRLQQVKIQFFFVFLLHFQLVSATDGWFSTGVRSFSLGNIRSVGDALLNPAALSFSDKKEAGLSVFNRFQMSELNTVDCYLKYPNRRLDAGAKFTTFGYEDYRLSQLQGSFSKRLISNLSVGIQINYLHETSRWEEDARASFSSSFGLYYRLNERIDLALSGENILSTSDIKAWTGQAGLQYRASDNAVLFLETAYEQEKHFRFSVGLEYTIWESFSIRSGYTSGSGIPALGVGYRWERWQVDAGFSRHSVLGMSSMIGVSYKL